MPLSSYSDEELAAIAQQGDLSHYSDAELEAIADGGSAKQRDAGSYTRSEINKLQAAFVAQEAGNFGASRKGGDTRKISYTSQKAKPEQTRRNRKQMADFVRPYAEGGGMVAGGIVGTPAGPAGNVGGAALGYAIGKKAVDTLEGKAPATIGDAALETAGDLATGATMEMGGQVLGKGLEAFVTGGKSLYKKGLPFSTKSNQIKAGDILNEVTEPSAVSASTNAAKEAEAQALIDRLAAEASPTPGQMTGNVRAGAFEQSMAARSPGLAERLKYNDAALNEAALNNLTGAVGPEAGPLSTQPAQQTGASLVTAVDGAKAAAKPIHEQFYANLPNTPLPTDDIAATVRQLKREFRTGDEAVYPASTIAKIEEAINPKPKMSHGHGQKPAAPEFGSGDIQTWAAKQAEPQVAPQVGFQDLHALRKDVSREIENALSGANPNRDKARRLMQLKDAIDTTIESNLGTNAAYQEAKNAYIQYAQKFKTGAVNDVLRKGSQITGLRLPEEAVPTKFFTPSGADDLVRAVGRDAAKQQMLPHVQNELVTRTVGQDGVMHVPRAMAYLRQNQAVLDKLGLTGEVKQAIREQVPAFLRSQLESRGVDVLGNPTMTARQSQKLLRDLAPALRQVYGGDLRPLKALQDYHLMLEVLGRNKNVSYAGGSNTIEKLFGAAPAQSLGRKLYDKLSAAVVSTMAGVAYGGPVGGAIGGTLGLAGKGAIDVAREHSATAIKALLEDAITNPETAHMLMNLAKGAKVSPTAINSRLMTLGLVGAKNAMQDQQQPAPTEYIYQNGELVPAGTQQ